MDLNLQQKQSQKLILAPQLRQFLKLLELPIYELKQKIEEELIQNPTLEEASSNEETSDEDHKENDQENRDLDEYLEHMEEFKSSLLKNSSTNRNNSDLQKSIDYQESILTKDISIGDYLEWQLSILDLSDTEKKIAVEIIGNINQDGLLSIALEEIASATGTALSQVEHVLRKVQTLDPPGVAGRDLKETLLIQLKRKNGTELAQKIIEEHMTSLEKKHFDVITKQMNVSADKIQSAYKQIMQMEPKPGRIFSHQVVNFVVPDAVVAPDPEDEEKFIIEITHESIPELRINSMYREMLRDKKTDQKTKTFIRERIQAGLDLIRSISQRKSTIRQITEILVEEQRDFFIRGFAFLKPLRLKDVAEKIRVHESTISRAIQNKYVSTPFGTIPYKSFFSTKLEGDDGSIESQKSVMERLKNIVAEENKKKPLSDAKIVQLLSQEKINISRRTVAKYRDRLKILPTYLRKQ